jgi:hypothetical protein
VNRTAATVLFMSLLLTTAGLSAQERKFRDWRVGILSGNSGVYAGTTNDSNGIFGQFCLKEDASCYWLLATDINCTEGNKYPVLVNSDAGASSQELYCIKIDGKPRYAFTNFDSINEIITASSRIGIAFPMANSQFQVSRFSLVGSNDALEVMLKVANELTKSSTSTNTKDQRL